jgi:hypothetical protein
MATKAPPPDGGLVARNKDLCRTIVIAANCNDVPSTCQELCQQELQFGKVAGKCVPNQGCQCTMCKKFRKVTLESMKYATISTALSPTPTELNTASPSDFYGPFSEVAEAPATTGASNDDNKGSIFGYLAIDDYANKGSIVGP